MQENRVADYEERLNNLPQVDPNVAAEIRKYEQLVDEQSTAGFK